MSKQYLTAHTIDNAHLATIYSIAITPKAILTASGSSTLIVYDATNPNFPLLQSLKSAHPTGCHHITASRDGRLAASVSFAGDIKIWTADPTTGEWKHLTSLETPAGEGPGAKKGTGVWMVALSEGGETMAASTMDARVVVWRAVEGVMEVAHVFDGFNESFPGCVAISGDGRFVASGHQNGAVYVFDTETGRLRYSLASLSRPIRTIAFSPAGTRLAAAGDAKIIALFDMNNGEHVGNLTGHSAWITAVDWNSSGDYLASCSLDGRVKVWSIDRGECVATHNETDEALWAIKWLVKLGRSEYFVTGGASKNLSFYREATGI